MPRIAINGKWCKACRICVKVCPRKVLEVDEARYVDGVHPIVAARPDDCTQCMQCELLCPDLAIEVGEDEDR